jgi:hypothetical protein
MDLLALRLPMAGRGSGRFMRLFVQPARALLLKSTISVRSEAGDESMVSGQSTLLLSRADAQLSRSSHAPG